MIVVRHVHVFGPFLQLAVFADLIGRDLRTHGGEFGGAFFVLAENFSDSSVASINARIIL
jgi:hypothetical protein